MPLASLSFPQRAIARAIETWCRGEGICTSRATLASFGTSVHNPTTALLLNLGDTDILIDTDRVVVRMPHRVAEFGYDPGEAIAGLIAAVTRSIETG